MRTESPDLRQLAQAVYSDLTSLALVIDRLPKGNPVLRTIRDQMQPIGRTVKRQEDVQQLILQGTRYWRETHAGSEKYGLAMIVDSEDVGDVDDAWTIVPLDASLTDEPPLQIFVPKLLAPALIPGQRLLLLGTVQISESTEEAAPSASIFTASYLHAL